MDLSIGHRIKEWLLQQGIHENYVVILKDIILFGSVIIISFILNWITKKFILRIIEIIAKKSETVWDDILIEHKVFTKLSHLVPAAVIYFLSPWALKDYISLIPWVQLFAKLYTAFIVLFCFNSFINAIHDIYKTYEISKYRPIKGYIQIAKIIINFIGGIIILSILLNKSPIYFLGGLGALTAVLMFVFKDAILGFIASIQLSANDMARPGDWITMNKYGVDGIIVEMNLTTIKVQNTDKTIIYIPSYSLISDAFQNWRGMQDSGVRRVKRSVFIDMNSIAFCDDNALNSYETNHLIAEFIKTTKKNITTNNIFRPTNLSVYIAYIENYLKQNSNIDPNQTLVVREQQATDNGMPIEIICFSKFQDLYNYERVQTEIFNHIIAIADGFNIKIFQKPTGNDVRINK